MKLLLFFYAIATVFKFIAGTISSLFRLKPTCKTEPIKTTRDWYGVCDKCGVKGGLHSFEGKRYCAKCHARLSTEKKFGIKSDSE